MNDKTDESNETAKAAKPVKHGKSTPYDGPRNFRKNAVGPSRDARGAALRAKHGPAKRQGR